jgi:NADPH-dependent glutamate synthase beta subunit-like oxidoreductase/NAD-dependent dihydropyrimidine dehydrogenase PreA subunit
MAKGVSIIGTGVQAAQCALTLGEMGIKVDFIVSEPTLHLNGCETDNDRSYNELHLWPLLLRAANHPNVTLHTNTRLENINRKGDSFVLNTIRKPRYVKEDLCTGCGDCEEECSVKLLTFSNGGSYKKAAIHAPVRGTKTVPSAYLIEKDGIAPCRAGCPLGINVQGYIALAGKGKIDKALELINQSAPMSAILGRLCTHPCENNCSRSKVDKPVFIKAIHRYVADNASRDIKYQRKAPAGSKIQKIAIIGSGPAGLTAAWELARRGYKPTVFESHSVIGGMLATGIPRFRLPHEIREREVEAIRSLGVEFKTGVHIGRDVTYNDLLDQDYQAFFIAIGANQNNRLNVPGEYLNGVLDCVSVLFRLNLKVGFSEQSEVVVIGGGNSAVDTARSAKRVSSGEVRILCLTEKMTAVEEDVEEALKEGILIDYNVNVTEVLGDGRNVTGVRYQKVRNVTFQPDGRINMEAIPGSDGTLRADHVVVAIGQKPNARNLDIKHLRLNKNTTVTVDPLTLQTNIRWVFAGGDCVTGSNNVVSAMAAGLRAAESIDRYLNLKDLKDGRNIDPPQSVDLDVSTREAAPIERGVMPVLSIEDRKNNFEETNLGFDTDMINNEIKRCLNCATCCECMECVDACKVNAVNHDDCEREVIIESGKVINFIDNIDKRNQIDCKGVIYIDNNKEISIDEKIAEASSAALTTAFEINSRYEKDRDNATFTQENRKIYFMPGNDKTAVFLCKCGDSISSVIDFEKVKTEIEKIEEVQTVIEIPQSCTKEGAELISKHIEEEKVDRVVLAACRCCNMDQICFSCTDRRVMCQRNLNLNIPEGVKLEFVNIREQCAWLFKGYPEGATDRAVEIVKAGVIRANYLEPQLYENRPVSDSVLVMTTGISGLAAAIKLSSSVENLYVMLDAEKFKKDNCSENYRRVSEKMLKQLESSKAKIFKWPESIELTGVPGQYSVAVKNDGEKGVVGVGAVVLDVTRMDKNALKSLSQSNLINRIMLRHHYLHSGDDSIHGIEHNFTVRETAGVFIIPSIYIEDTEKLIETGNSVSARVLSYINQNYYKPRSSSVVIKQELCRGCGDCIELCPLIEIRKDRNNKKYAYVDPALCYGCGACVSVCPTGAIVQPLQSETSIMVALESLLKKAESVDNTDEK